MSNTARWRSSLACLLLALIALTPAWAESATTGFGAVPCSALGPGTAKLSPEELYGIVASCATAARYDVAIEAFAAAGTYGKYDMARVSDETAYGVLGVLKNLALNSISAANREEFRRLAGRAYDDRPQHDAICARLRQFGPPVYEPDYMINHGLGAVAGAMGAASSTSRAPLRSNFEPEVAWRQALSSYFSCQ